MLKVAITGGIGAGKSTVLELLQHADSRIRTLSSDQIVHELLRSNQDIQAEIGQLFGQQMVGQEGVDRQALARRVFSNRADLERLEQLLHPYVRQRIEQQIRQWEGECDIVFVEVPLLFETGMETMYDATVAVIADDAIRQERRPQMDLSSRSERQLSQSQKADKADYVIQNNGDRSKLEAAVARFVQQIQFDIGE